MENKGRPLYEDILRNIGENEISIIKRIISNYTFIDYGIVQSYNNGLIEVILAHKMLDKDIRLIDIEVLSLGSKSFSTEYALVKGDIVQLVSSKSLVDSVAELAVATSETALPYSVSTIKALPLANAKNSKNKLVMNADGSWSLAGTDYTIAVTTDGEIQINGSDKSFTIWEELNTVYQAMLEIVKAHVHPGINTASPTLTALVSDLTAAKTTTVKTNG